MPATERAPARILTVRDGAAQPLFGAIATPARSPSPSLLIEAHEIGAGNTDWHTHRIPTQLITLQLQGSSILHAEDHGAVRQIPLPARAVVFSLRDRQESIRWLAPARFLSVGISDAVLAAAADEYGGGWRFELQPHPGVHDERLAALLYALYLEQADGYSAGRLFVDGIEQALAAMLVRRYHAPAPRRAAAAGVLPPHLATRVADFMQANLHRLLTLEELAHCAGYSQAHFSRLFHASFGCTPHQYALGLRIAHAKRQLRDPRHAIIDIAVACGFQNAQHFARAFRRLTDVSPSQFRRASD